MKPYGGKTPSSCYICCKAHSGPAHMANKRRERFRAANDIASQDAVYRLEDYQICIGDLDCRCACCEDDQEGLDAFDANPLPPLTAPLVALALEAA